MAHRKPEKRYINFLIIPDGKEEPRSLRLRLGMFRFIIVLLVVFFILVTGGFFAYWKLGSLLIQNNRLKEENFKLVNNLKQIDKLKEELASLKGYEKKIRSSIQGYVKIVGKTSKDTVPLSEINFENRNREKTSSLFNSIPSLIPVNGFIARGFETSSLFSDAHLGVDIAAQTNTPIRAPADGVVVMESWTDDGGNVLVIEHAFNYITIYKHNQVNLVSELEYVKKGQVIALLGNTGKITSGPHLHYEIWHNGKPVNPIYYLNEETTK